MFLKTYKILITIYMLNKITCKAKEELIFIKNIKNWLIFIKNNFKIINK